MYRYTFTPASVAVVLGAGINADYTASTETRLRAEAAVRLAKGNPEIEHVILCGLGPRDKAEHQLSEAEVMARLLRHYGVNNVLLEDQSVDTMGNAILVAARYLQHENSGSIYLVTSPFHMKRAAVMFRYVFGSKWNVFETPAEPADNDEVRGKNEQGGIDWVYRIFGDITPGDLFALTARLRQERPYYNSVSLLDLVEAKPAQLKHRFTRCTSALRKAAACIYHLLTRIAGT